MQKERKSAAILKNSTKWIKIRNSRNLWLLKNGTSPKRIKKKRRQSAKKFNIDPFVAYLLAARGKVSEIAVSEFLSDEIRLSDPFDLLDMERAVERIEKAVESGEKITVYGDYDCDGVTSTVLLYSFFARYGGKC